MPLSIRQIKLAGATNRAPEVRRAVENFFRWAKECHPGSFAELDVQADTEFLNYLHLAADTKSLGFFQGALSVFLFQEGVEVS